MATTSGTDGELILARSGSNEFFAFASGGPNPNVTAVVTDADGTGLEGIEVNFSASAGSMSVATGYTGPDGVVTSIQTGGALGNTITVESGALGIRTVFVDDSYDVNAIDRSYGWFDKIRRTVNVATVNRTTNVLANAGTITATALDRTLNNGVLLTTGSATTQNNATPADIIVSPGTYGQGDRLSIGTTTTTPSIDLIINLPAPSNLYLDVYASAGPNPNVTAVVTDSGGNGVSGVTVEFTSTAGSMDVSSSTTGNDGTLTSTQIDGSIGDLIHVYAANLSNITVLSSAFAALAAADTAVAWYDVSTNNLLTIPITRLTKTIVTTSAAAFILSDNTPNNTTGFFTDIFQQSNNFSANITPVNFSSGDIVNIFYGTTTPVLDAAIVINQSALTDINTVAAQNNATNFFAFATNGTNPIVTAVVTDSDGYGIPDITVSFSSSVGTMSPTSGVTSLDGTVSSTQSGGTLGDTITVSSDNLTDIAVITNESINVAAPDTVYTWFDSNLMVAYTVTVNTTTKVLAGATTTTYTLDSFATYPLFSATISGEPAYEQNATQGTPSNITLTPRSYRDNDRVRVDVGTTTFSPDNFIRLICIRYKRC